jgi:hypothetical protein
MTGITTVLFDYLYDQAMGNAILFAGSTSKRANQKSPVAEKKLKVFIIEVVKF